ncbi:MAG: histidine phosphatase family protein, partial [Flavobacteriales bacterium]|nr:histidine phosphatase family protein [Flavobacteriales bacterium]
LYLIRHAKSSWSDPLQADFHRELNGRGLRDAPAMGKHFAARGERVDLFVSSPAVRALTTARAVAQAFGVPPGKIVTEPKLYLASTPTWMEVVNTLPSAVRSAALFSHNPGISEFCELLTEGGLGELPTCAMVRVDNEVDSWASVSRGNGAVAWYDFPKQHAELQ